jgi:excisionase family DNA binding protein
MLAESSYLTLKSAARVLGVHEQTLRSWERKGIIRMARLPGSQYRRVPVDEVRRLQEVLATPAARKGVRLEYPQNDEVSRSVAFREAEAIRAELAEVERGQTLDELMQARRGRVWSP